MVSGVLGALSPDAMLARIVLYQIVGQLVGGALQPYWRELEQIVNQRTPNVVLSPVELAALVERSYIDEGTGAAEAAKSGIDAAAFHEMVQLQETAPPPEWLAVALRRALIPEDDGNAEGTSFMAGIAQGTIAKKWAPIIKEMAVNLPSPEMALEAYLEGQTSEANARRLYGEWGGNPEHFTLLYNTRGQAPTPLQAALMANRGVIPWEGEGAGVTSFHQAFLEGPWRNKWEAAFLKLAEYTPPPRTITTMVRDGSLSDEQALRYFRAQGMTVELSEAYLRSAHRDRTEGERELSMSMLKTLYSDQLLTRAEFVESLTQMGYSAEDADWIAESVDVRRQAQAVNTLVSKIHTLYVAHKIEIGTVTDAFSRIGISGEQQARITELWGIERGANTRDLTPAQILAAWDKEIIPEGEAQTLLVQQGYTPRDAWVLMSSKDGKKLAGEPPRESPGGGN